MHSCDRFERPAGSNVGHSCRGSRRAAGSSSRAKCFGQLVLSIDLAPPRVESTLSLVAEPIALGSQHQAELSLCVKQNDRSQDELSQNNCGANLLVACDNRRQSRSRQSRRTQRKRELIYERVDRFVWPIGMASRGDKFELPFRSDSFDACFCFNLLNIRMANIHDDDPDLAERLIEHNKQEQVEKNWLEMERTTTKFRVDFLQELTRIVKANGKWEPTFFADLRSPISLLLPSSFILTLMFCSISGKIMISVFACDCGPHSRQHEKPNSEGECRTQNESVETQAVPIEKQQDSNRHQSAQTDLKVIRSPENSSCQNWSR